MKKILYFFLGIVGLFSASFFALKNGISIASIHFDFLKLEQLYIKLDNKLTLRAQNIIIAEREDNASLNENLPVSKELVKIAQNLDLLYAFVKEIQIENLHFKERRAKILFKDDEFFLDGDLFFLHFALHSEGKNLRARIKELFVKDYGVSIEGDLSVNTKSGFYHFRGNASSEDLDFNATLSYKDNQLAYKFHDVSIKNIHALAQNLRPHIDLPQELQLWLLEKTRASFYHLDDLQGFVDFKRDAFYFDELNATGFANDVELRLDGGMSPIKIPKLKMKLAKQRLNFTFAKATYKNADLSGSKVYLYDILNEENIGIYLHIRSENMIFDADLARALKPYGITLPFHQKSGKLRADFELKADFFAPSKPSYSGAFVLDDAALSLADFRVQKAKVLLKDGNLSIENASISNGFLEADFNAQIDLERQNGLFDAQISRLHFAEIFDMREQKVLLHLDYADGPKLAAKAWNLNADFTQGLELHAGDLSVLLPHFIPAKKIALESVQSLHYKSPDFIDFSLQINNASFGEKFFIDGKTPYVQDSFSVSKQKNRIVFDSKSKLISGIFDEEGKELHLKNLSYIYKDSGEGENFDLQGNQQNIKLSGTNVGVILPDFNKTLKFDQLEASLEGSALRAKANRKGATFSLFYAPEDFYLRAKDMDDEFLDTFLQKEAFKDGLFHLDVRGSGVDFFEGHFDIENTYIKDLKGINQLITFIDTVPALVMFKSPKFNTKGLHLRDGKVIFNRKKDLLSFEAINLNGDNVDLFGLGSANLRFGTIDLNLELKTLKSSSDVISKIPIVNYVILGEDQEISTNIKVDGSLEDPDFHTQILSDTLKTPFNLIKNIIELPKNLFDQPRQSSQ